MTWIVSCISNLQLTYDVVDLSQVCHKLFVCDKGVPCKSALSHSQWMTPTIWSTLVSKSGRTEWWKGISVYNSNSSQVTQKLRSQITKHNFLNSCFTENKISWSRIRRISLYNPLICSLNREGWLKFSNIGPTILHKLTNYKGQTWRISAGRLDNTNQV